MTMLQLDLVYVRLEDPIGEAPVEMVRTAQPGKPMSGPQEIGEPLNHCLGNDPRQWPPAH